MGEDYKKILNRITSRTIAFDILANITTIGFWVKDMDFKFLEISECAAKILYGVGSEDCIGKTDFQIAKSNISEDQFTEVCRGSDLYILNNPIEKYRNYMFYEFLTDTNGQPHIWKTIKGIYPDTVGGGRFYYGQALFIDGLYGNYEDALKRFEVEKHLYTKINDYLYVNK